jgi:hypothetical protein
VFTGRVPYHGDPRDATVLFKVTMGIRPERPVKAAALGLSDLVWSLMEDCWQHKWEQRPKVLFVLQRLEEADRQFVPTMDNHPISHASIVDQPLDDDDDLDVMTGGSSSPLQQGDS